MPLRTRERGLDQMKNQTRTLAMAVLAAIAIQPCVVYADVINPRIRDTGKVYSSDKPDQSLYGTGMGGRAAEASDLRFAVERDLQDGLLDQAILKAKKAVQFDPSDPETHLLLARAMTKKFYSKKGPPDEKLLVECLYEWTMLWHHDSDQWEQLEAKRETKRMMRIAKAIARQKQDEQIARNRAKEELAKQRREDAGKVAAKPNVSEASATKRVASPEPTVSKPTGAASGGRAPADANAAVDADPDSVSDSDSATGAGKPQLATKKKRFGLF
jgi:hypothetical protein